MHKDDTCPTCGHWRHTRKCDYSWCRCERPDVNGASKEEPPFSKALIRLYKAVQERNVPVEVNSWDLAVVLNYYADAPPPSDAEPCPTCGKHANPVCSDIYHPKREGHVYEDGVLQPSDAAQPVAWRTRLKAGADPRWYYNDRDPLVDSRHEVQPLYVHPSDAPRLDALPRTPDFHPDDRATDPWELVDCAGGRWAVANEGENREIWPIPNEAEAIAVRDALNRLATKGEGETDG